MPSNSKPRRIQRKRVKGWRMPENTVSVCRPGKFGNPFTPPIINDVHLSLRLFRESANGCWSPELIKGFSDHNAHKIYVAHCDWIKRFNDAGYNTPLEAILHLRGKNLACFCKEGEPCHADVLLELANQ